MPETYTRISQEDPTVAVETSLTDWENEPSVRDLKHDFTSSQSNQNTQVAKISKWLDNLNITGTNVKKKIAGKSNVQPKLIRKQAEWRYASLSEPFLSTDNLFTISPVTYEDKNSAIQNEYVINNQFNTRIDKSGFIDNYIRTAVNEGTVIVRVGWENEEIEEEVEEPVYIYRPASTPSELTQIARVMEEAQADPFTFDNRRGEHVKQMVERTVTLGVPMIAVQDGTRTVTRITVLKNQPTVEVCDYNNITIDPSCGGNFSAAKFLIYSFETSLDELRKDGRYSNLDSIRVNNNSVLSEPDHTPITRGGFDFQDEPRKRFVAQEYWGEWDIDDSGITTPIVATYVGNTMIRLEENPFPDRKIPFVVVPYLPVRRSVYGEPDGELLIDNQEIIGAVTRGMIDIMGRSAAGQTGIRKDALDSPNKRKFDNGQDYEFNPQVDPRQAIINHVYPEIPQSASLMLGLQNSEAESLTGVRPFNSTNGGSAIAESATAVRGALDAASKRELGILRRLSNGILQIGRKIIAMNAEFLSTEEVVRITNDEFIEVSRDDLEGNFDLRLTITTAEEDNQKAQELSFMLQTIGNSMDIELTKIILSEITRLRKMPVISKRIEEFQPQPDPVAQQRAALELQNLQLENEKLRSEIARNYANAGSEQAKASNTQADTDMKNLNFVEQESGVTQARELQRQGAQAQANAGLEIVKAALNNGTPN